MFFRQFEFKYTTVLQRASPLEMLTTGYRKDLDVRKWSVYKAPDVGGQDGNSRSLPHQGRR